VVNIGRHMGGPSWPSSRADHGARAEWIRASAAWRDTVVTLRLSSREVQIVECLLDAEQETRLLEMIGKV
jgi:hypothetical protein